MTPEDIKKRVQEINSRINFLDGRIQCDIDERDDLWQELESIQQTGCPHVNDAIDPIPKGSNFYTVRCTDCGTTEQGITEVGIAFLKANGENVSDEMIALAAKAKAEAGKGEKK